MRCLTMISTLALALVGLLGLPGCGDDEPACESFCNKVMSCCGGECTSADMDACMTECEGNENVYNSAGLNTDRIISCMKSRYLCSMSDSDTYELMFECAAAITGHDGSCDSSAESKCYNDVNVGCADGTWWGVPCAALCLMDEDGYTEYSGTCGTSYGSSTSETEVCWCVMP